jgi:hypothetical protein
MSREFYYPPRVGRVTYITPFYVPPSGRITTPDDWRALRRINRFNFLLHNAVYEPPTPAVPLSNIGPPHRLSELHILGERPSRYYPTGQTWEIDVMKRFNIYNFFKDNLTSSFLESPTVPEEIDISQIDRPVDLPLEITIPKGKRKFSDLDQIDFME